jgi:hypothetical protein
MLSHEKKHELIKKINQVIRKESYQLDKFFISRIDVNAIIREGIGGFN